jgi:hypothetical protein
MVRMKPKKRAGRPKSAKPFVPVLSITGTAEFREWFDQLSKKTLIPKRTLVRAALALWAETNGHALPPEK